MKRVESVVERLEKFAKSFDNQDWDQMRECLSDEVWVDYSDLRNTDPTSMSSSNYVELRKTGLKNLETIHSFNNFETQLDKGRARCNCDFVIKRFDNERNDYFHSFGKYQFDLVRVNGRWEIVKITQTVERSDGNKKVHGALIK